MASLNSHTQTGYTELDDVTAKDSFFRNPYLMAETFSHLQVEKYQCLFNAALTCKDFLDVALDALWEELDSWVPLLKLLPALKVDNKEYVLSGNVSQADWDRLQYYSRKVKFLRAAFYHDTDSDDPKVHPSTYIRITQQLQSSVLFPSLRYLRCFLDDGFIPDISLFLSPLLDTLELHSIGGIANTTIVGSFLATLSCQMLSHVTLRNGLMPADILNKSIVHFKQLRSLELHDVVFMSNFVLWEVLGTLPSLANLTLQACDPASHPAHAPENPTSQSGGPKYFDVLESLSVTGSFFLIEHLLGFIDSSCLKSISIYSVINHVLNEHDGHEPEDLLTPSMTIVASKWSQSLKHLVIGSTSSECAISRCLMLLTDLHELQNFFLKDWRMENMDDDVRRLVKSWPKLRTLKLLLKHSSISLSTLRIIAENCPDLRFLIIKVDTSTIPPFDTSSRSLRHTLPVMGLYVGGVHSSTITQTTLKCQIQVARYVDFIFPYLKFIKAWPKDDVTWSPICDLLRLCQDARRVEVGGNGNDHIFKSDVHSS